MAALINMPLSPLGASPSDLFLLRDDSSQQSQAPQESKFLFRLRFSAGVSLLQQVITRNRASAALFGRTAKLSVCLSTNLSRKLTLPPRARS